MIRSDNCHLDYLGERVLHPGSVGRCEKSVLYPLPFGAGFKVPAALRRNVNITFSICLVQGYSISQAKILEKTENTK